MLASSIVDAWREIRPDDRVETLYHRDIDLRDAGAVSSVIRREAPDLVIHAAAMVGGIGDKLARPLPYLLDNIRIDAAVLNAVVEAGVPSYLYTGSAAAYPVGVVNPIHEDDLFTGKLEPANEGYGLAKLTGLTAVRYAAQQTGRAYRAILPSNLYGPGDSLDPFRSHLIASALYKAHHAVQAGADAVEVWGDGTARREFTYAPDVAEWLASTADEMADWPMVMNVGAGEDYTVREYYEIACQVTGFSGELRFDASKPSGVARRLMDSTAAAEHGWAPRTSIVNGMEFSYRTMRARM